MKRLLYILVIMQINISCLSSRYSEHTYLKMDPNQFIEEYNHFKDQSILIDVRTVNEYNQGSILDALNIDFYNKNFPLKIAQLDNKKTVFVFCHSGGRSKQSRKVFFKLGFKKVIDLRGGIKAFRKN